MNGKTAARAGLSSLVLAVAATATAAAPPPASAREQIVIDDTGVFPESITSSSKGTVWIGSIAKGSVYRADPGAGTATRWIAPGADGVKSVLGVFADDKRKLLWVCGAGDKGSATQAPTRSALRTFSMDKSKGAPKLKGTYLFEGGGGCNDMAMAKDGTIYASDFDLGRIMILKKGDTQFRPWISDPGFVSADGVAVLGDAVYFTTYRAGGLWRVPINRNGSAGKPVRIEAGTLTRPDCLRAIGGRLVLVEGGGRVSELTIEGDTAQVRVLKDNIPDNSASATLVGKTLYVIQAKFAYMRDRSRDPGSFAAFALPYEVAPLKKGK